MPRPREGPRAVDAFMIPLLDEEVAYEVLRYVGYIKQNDSIMTTKCHEFFFYDTSLLLIISMFIE